MKARTRAALLLIFAAAVTTWLWSLCHRNPRVAFLSPNPAAWIVFPSVADLKAQIGTDMPTTFRREFTVQTKPAQAAISWRALNQLDLTLNGHAISTPAGPNWKHVSRTDITAQLRPGTNMLEATVRNRTGPAALSLLVQGDGLSLTSDSDWQVSCGGSAWRSAVVAASDQAIKRAGFYKAGETTLGSLAGVWPLWLVFAAVAAGLLVIAHLAFKTWCALKSPELACDQLAWSAWAVLATGWVILFWHNLPLLPAEIGFDAHDHLAYIERLEQHWILPFPNEGMQMFQPPLYYIVGAALLAGFNLTIHQETGIVLLRLLHLAAGIAQLTLAFLSLRLLFPRRLVPQLVGLGLAAFLPMHLYLSHYITNETFAALMVSTSVFLCLRVLKSPMDRFAPFLLLGIALAAAILSKFTAVLALPCVLGAITIELHQRGEPLRKLTLKVGLTLGAVLLFSAWHYIRVWHHMGHLVIGGWDASVGVAWWQEPGFRTARFFTSVGRGLFQPLFSGTLSFSDGLYTTMWGDSLCAGAAEMVRRPPWNYPLVCAGYLLALVPTALIVIGAIETVWKLIRDGGGDRFLLASLAGAIGLGLVYLNLTVPCHATVKAFYALVALVPLCCFAATGWQTISRAHPAFQWGLGLFLLICGLSNFAAVWIRPDSVATRICRGLALQSAVNRREAAAQFARAVELAPSNSVALRLNARALAERGQLAEALRQAKLAVQLNPHSASDRMQLAAVLAKAGDMEQAMGEARQAIQNDPDYSASYQLLSTWLETLGRADEAAAIAREGLAISPTMPELQFALANALLRGGDIPAASNRFEMALALRPNWTSAHFQLGMLAFNARQFARAAEHFRVSLEQFPFDPRTHRMLGLALAGLRDPAAIQSLREAVRLAPRLLDSLNALAWLRATDPDPAWRDGAEALKLAQEACKQSPAPDASFLATLAAAYAETGQFNEAATIARAALELARTNHNEQAESIIQRALALYEAGKPYRQPR